MRRWTLWLGVALSDEDEVDHCPGLPPLRILMTSFFPRDTAFISLELLLIIKWTTMTGLSLCLEAQ